MKDKFEQFFLRGLDKDSFWWPFVRLRPAQTEHITLRLAFAILLSFTLLTPFFLLAASSLIVWLRLSGAFVPVTGAFSWPFVVSVWLNFMSWLYPLALFLRALLLSLRVWAWNRRAARLAKMPPEETPPPVEGVWPPPPRVPKS